MTLAEQKAVVAHTSEAFSDTEPNVVTEAAKAVLKDSEARGGGVQMLGVDKIYPGSTVKALDDFNLEINPGEMVVLLGGSGCGKSTALRSLAGLEDIQAGRILVGGQDVTGVPVNKRDMAMVFQAYSLFPHMTALQNVEFGLEIRGVDRAERRRQAMEKLELVGLADQAKKYTQQMSGGQQQRVALARALAVNPRVLLLDEPLSALDAKVRVQLRDEIRRIQLEAGTTTVFVTHDQEEALAVADRIGVMNHGRIEQIADPQTLYRRPGTEYVATFIGLTNRLPGIANGEEAVVFGQRVPLLDGSATDASTVLVRPENMTIELTNDADAVVFGQRVPLLDGSATDASTVLVRPENMTIELTNDADAVHGAGELGRVEMVHFLGALARVDVRVACAGMGGTIRVTVQLPANELPAGLAIGAQVVVAPRPIPALAV